MHYTLHRVLLAAAGAFFAFGATAEDRVLITSEFPNEGDATVIEQTGGGLGGDSFISGGPILNEPQKIVFGPDDNLYLLDEQNIGNKGGGDEYAVLRYNGTSGAFIDFFIAPGASGLNEAKDMIFGPDGNLYISVNETGGGTGEGGEVWRFNGATGAFMGVFVANGSGGGGDEDLGEAMGLVFTAAGDLLVGNENSGENILRFSGTTGAYIDTFVGTDDNGLDDPQYMVIGPDGNLYVTSETPDVVLRYNGTTGAFIDVFVTDGSGGMDEPKGLGFGFDGNLYVVGGDSNGIYRYNGSTGSFIDVFVPPANSNMLDGRSLLFFMRVAEVPAIEPWGIAALIIALVGIAGFVLVRRRRGGAAA